MGVFRYLLVLKSAGFEFRLLFDNTWLLELSGAKTLIIVVVILGKREIGCSMLYAEFYCSLSPAAHEQFRQIFFEVNCHIKFCMSAIGWRASGCFW